MASSSHLLCVGLLFLHMNVQAVECASTLGNATDRMALLSIKEITSDPHGALSSWNDSLHFCMGPGVVCRSGDQSVMILDLSSLDLEGSISPYIGNLSFLRRIEFQENSFHGEIPRGIGSLFYLQYLNLGFNSFQGNDFKALVFEYMPNGNLNKWLHLEEDGQNHLQNLSFTQRLNIAIEVASAVEYLHHHCQMPIVYCDLKPSNILLDNGMIAHVGVYWICSPEYGLGGQISTRGDVYSYGILLLEKFTGRRPTDDLFKDGLNLHEFAKMALSTQLGEIVHDPRLLLVEVSTDLINTNGN
ncbi:putative LRR receptor-like serine/threonine-protein kinase [Cinnamomum micranthum f. kanehirae]|uniref:Putative LRR receptor-like serine/threonine-protein kinase n=1 Tax=Cinnamomum micranthum f. kanehirae TaxID=337451 RepID=A0A3S3MF81_9MAGN|nr:putative LRR receptor-like serine/threonine-protein kinase [Cinnamomum micranthum f. kanehirae]